MVVVDSSALIPLSWVGRLDLIDETFDEIRAVEGVREEVLSGGERGALPFSNRFSTMQR